MQVFKIAVLFCPETILLCVPVHCVCPLSPWVGNRTPLFLRTCCSGTGTGPVQQPVFLRAAGQGCVICFT